MKIIYTVSLILLVAGCAGSGLYIAGVLQGVGRQDSSQRLSEPTSIITTTSTSVTGNSDGAAGFQDGPNPLSDRPSACVVDEQDKIYVADTNKAIRLINEKKNHIFFIELKIIIFENQLKKYQR